jgi:hypothetical protein
MFGDESAPVFAWFDHSHVFRVESGEFEGGEADRTCAKDEDLIATGYLGPMNGVAADGQRFNESELGKGELL